MGVFYLLCTLIAQFGGWLPVLNSDDPDPGDNHPIDGIWGH